MSGVWKRGSVTRVIRIAHDIGLIAPRNMKRQLRETQALLERIAAEAG